MSRIQADEFTHAPLLDDLSELSWRLHADRFMRAMVESGHDDRRVEALTNQQVKRTLRAIRIERILALWLDILDGVRRWAHGKYQNVIVPKTTRTVLKAHEWAKRQFDSTNTTK